jgi:subtilisin family serine protease
MKLLFVVAAALTALAAGTAVAATGPGHRQLAPIPGVVKAADLDSRLSQVFQSQRDAGRGGPTARGLGLDVVAGRVRVVIEARSGVGAARDAATAAGGEVEGTYANLVQALVPPASLAALSRSPAVAYLRAPHQPVAAAISGEEIVRSSADAFQAALWTGSGVKVAIIDLGFIGLAARQAAGDLPADVTTQDFCGGGFSTATEHGTAVAEIVHEVAPDAQLSLICINSDVTLAQAEEYVKANGITIVNTSFGIFNDSRGDGKGGAGTVDSIVADARANGILWVAAAGNLQQAHWSGTFNGGGNFVDLHDFGPGDETNDVVIGGGQTACFFLKWDAWPTTQQDYDLYLLNGPDPSTATPVAYSLNDQATAPGLPPTEEFCYTNPGAAATYYLLIQQFSATATPRFDLYMIDTSSLPQYRVPTGSLAEPASSPNVMGVGALCWYDGSLRPYSSLGPTIDGRTKPDIAGLDGVSGGTYGIPAGCSGGFTGTSAASPHVAGLAALGKQQNPSLTPAQLQTWLEARAVDVGTPGRDNQTGAGRAYIYTFTDSPPTTPLQSYIEQLFTRGITTGCSVLDVTTGARAYCPDQVVTRRDMAVFIVRAQGLTELIPPTPTFADVPSSEFGFGHVERFFAQGITTGCAVNPLRYCPLDPVTRRDMAVFIVRAKDLSELIPPTPTFADVPSTMFGFGHVERFFEQGITTGCDPGPPRRYCPLDFVDRKAMAAFLIRAFGAPSV